MKKLLLLLFCLPLIGFGQCIPNPNYTTPGSYPDSITNLPVSFVGQTYNEIITLVIPIDTTVIVGGTNFTVAIDSVAITNITGLPNNFSYSCNPPNCIFPGNSTGCVSLYSTTNPILNQIGVYPLIIERTNYALSQSLTDSVTYYEIEIVTNFSWDCGPTGCYDPGTGLGQYTSFTACDTVCGTPTPSWDCVTGSCIDPGNGAGMYTDSLQCVMSCNSTSILNLQEDNVVKLDKIIDLFGRETIFNKNRLLIYLYKDGTVKKKMVIE